MFDNLITNWKTTLIGALKLANNLVAAVQVYNDNSGGMVPAAILVQFFALNAALQFFGNALTKDADLGSNVPTKYVDPISDKPRA